MRDTIGILVKKVGVVSSCSFWTILTKERYYGSLCVTTIQEQRLSEIFGKNVDWGGGRVFLMKIATYLGCLALFSS